MGSKSSKEKKDPSILTDEEFNMLKTNTQYTEEEIQAWHSGFLKDCPSGKLDKKQFLNVYKVCIEMNFNSILTIYYAIEILSGR
jgi:Ca2+-binding EF-hand superfamily protein